MKTLVISVIIMAAWTTIYGQDGSDMRYIAINNLDKSFIGKFAHLDFYRKSFLSSFDKFSGHLREIDTVVVNIDNKPVRFIECRNDNGFNNWFYQQYLVSLEPVNGNIIRISKCRINNIRRDSIRVTNYLDFYDRNNTLIPGKSKQQSCWFKKEIITVVLIKSKQL